MSKQTLTSPSLPFACNLFWPLCIKTPSLKLSAASRVVSCAWTLAHRRRFGLALEEFPPSLWRQKNEQESTDGDWDEEKISFNSLEPNWSRERRNRDSLLSLFCGEIYGSMKIMGKVSACCWKVDYFSLHSLLFFCFAVVIYRAFFFSLHWCLFFIWWKTWNLFPWNDVMFFFFFSVDFNILI